MSHISMQQALVAQLEPVHAKAIGFGFKGQDTIGKLSRLKRLHMEAMRRMGYTQREAAESAAQCGEVAYRNADHAAYLKGMGAAQ